MNSVNPNSFSSGYASNPNAGVSPQTQNQDVSSGQFSVNNPSIPQSAIPTSNPITQTPDSVATGILANSTAQGDKAIAQAAASGGGSKGGGSGLGGSIGQLFGGPIGGAIGNIFESIFAQGGMVGSPGYAEGGSVGGSKEAMTLGYLVGALHQRDFNGTPDTLQNAAEMIKNKISGSQDTQGFASGGDVNSSPDTMLAQQALAQALGMGNANTPQSSAAPEPQPMQNAQVQPVDTQAPQTGPNGQQVINQDQPKGYAQPLAMGGPPMPQGNPNGATGQGDPNSSTPPLKPGQAFQGDGSVKGPGGPTDDSIPAKLSNGEFVMAADAVQFFGVDKLTKMNEQGKQGYMQALGQVQQNQQDPNAPQGSQGPSGQPQMQQGTSAPQMQGMPPGGPPQPPMGQAKGGPATRPSEPMPNMRHGYMGL